MSKEFFAKEAISQIPKILTLLDRNPHSPTYGCFDRNFWHYKIIDFPSGMAQEFVWPLALAYESNVTNNPFYKKPAIKEWVEAGILFASRSAHTDGSCDDYFPYERALGATAFSLLACIESYILLGIKDETALRFFEKRGDWLANYQESGQLSNHQALITLCLELLSRLFNTTKWDRLKEKRLERLLSWQSPEGWFQEYEGCDPGYLTLTISLLARLYELRPTPKLKESLVRAVNFAWHFLHPDGSYGGEYGSRNTYNFFPNGFELVGKWMPEALSINDHFLIGLANGLSPCYGDDHIIGLHAWSYLLAFRDFVVERSQPIPRPKGRTWFKEAKILIDRRDDTELYIALNKGGVFKLFRNNQLVLSDTQFSLMVKDGEIKNAVGHLIDKYKININENEILIEGTLGWAKHIKTTPTALIAFRLLMISIGRLFPNLIRRLLQKMLITSKREAPFTFSRRFRWENKRWKIIDELRAESWKNVVSAGIGCDQTSIYNVMSRTFQIGQLQPWYDHTDEVKKLSPGQPLKLERNL
ncbi:MAG TPA: hypothetical protein VI935_02935 [Thermodesulfobacteriota bacterium]|nr:hypothetical protein [Thermodesulfobacteriota bacterium]